MTTFYAKDKQLRPPNGSKAAGLARYAPACNVPRAPKVAKTLKTLNLTE